MEPLFSKTNLKKNIDTKRKLIKVAMICLVFGIFSTSFLEAKTNLSTKEKSTISCAAMAGLGLLSIRQLDPNPPGGGGDDAEKKALLEEIKKIAEKQGLELKAKIEALETSGKASELELKSYKDKFAALESKKVDLKEIEEFKTLAVEFASMVIEVKALKEQGVEKKDESKMKIEAILLKALTENKDAILKSMKEGKPYDMELKYPETVTEDNTILDGSTFQSLTQNTGIVSSIRRRITRYLENVSVGNITSRFALWFEEVASDGKPYFIHEKETKVKAGFKIVEKTEPVKKVAVRGKMSMEWMQDLPQFLAYFKNKLSKQMDIETEDQLFNGTGGTGSDEPLGIMANAVAFTGGSLAGEVALPNVADVIRALVLQVTEALGIANAVFVHPSVLAKLDVMKTTEGLYIRPSWANGTLVAGIRVIETMALSADEFVGGDLTVMNVLFREGMTVRIGETGDDFQENKKSILLEQRLVQFISANDYAQIVKGNWSTAIPLIEVGS